MVVRMQQCTTERSIQLKGPSLKRVESSQVKYLLLHGRLERIGEASADTAATETYYMNGYYNLEEETIKVKI